MSSVNCKAKKGPRQALSSKGDSVAPNVGGVRYSSMPGWAGSSVEAIRRLVRSVPVVIARPSLSL